MHLKCPYILKRHRTGRGAGLEEGKGVNLTCIKCLHTWYHFIIRTMHQSPSVGEETKTHFSTPKLLVGSEYEPKSV